MSGLFAQSDTFHAGIPQSKSPVRFLENVPPTDDIAKHRGVPRFRGIPTDGDAAQLRPGSVNWTGSALIKPGRALIFFGCRRRDGAAALRGHLPRREPGRAGEMDAVESVDVVVLAP